MAGAAEISDVHLNDILVAVDGVSMLTPQLPSEEVIILLIRTLNFRVVPSGCLKTI